LLQHELYRAPAVSFGAMLLANEDVFNVQRGLCSKRRIHASTLGRSPQASVANLLRAAASGGDKCS
jgi:plasmid stability protein